MLSGSTATEARDGVDWLTWRLRKELGEHAADGRRDARAVLLGRVQLPGRAGAGRGTRLGG